MFARHRDFLYKRSQNGAHLGLAARLSPASLAQGQIPNPPAAAAASPSPDPKTSEVVIPFTPVGPVAKTTDTPTPSPSPDTPSSPTPTTPSASPSSSPSSSPSPAQTSSLSTSSSATTRTTPSIVSTPLNVASSTPLYTAPAATTKVVGVSLTHTSTLPPTATPSAGSGSSSGTNTGAIIGGVAGTLAGIAVLGFLLMWCMRRQRNRDVDDFDTQAFKRQSAILVDDPVEPSRSYNPRPPTMIERHNASPALAAQTGYSGQNFYGSYGGYGQQPPYGPPETIQPAGSPPPQAYGAPPMGYAGYNNPQQQIVRQPSDVGHATYDGQQQLARQPSDAAYLTRQPTSAAGYAPPIAPPGSHDPNAQYIDLNRSSVSPYQAVQYADISRQLGATDPNAQVPHESLELPEGPLPSPFDDPVEATAGAPHHVVHPTDVTASGPVTSTSAPQTQQNVAEPHQRPVTLYEEGDAYGGI